MIMTMVINSAARKGITTLSFSAAVNLEVMVLCPTRPNGHPPQIRHLDFIRIPNLPVGFGEGWGLSGVGI